MIEVNKDIVIMLKQTFEDRIPIKSVYVIRDSVWRIIVLWLVFSDGSRVGEGDCIGIDDDRESVTYQVSGI